jgi:Bacterial regulatory proteins, luxR family
LAALGAAACPDALTPRELDVLRLLCSGVARDRQIAEHLTIAVPTAHGHVNNIMGKLVPRIALRRSLSRSHTACSTRQVGERAQTCDQGRAVELDIAPDAPKRLPGRFIVENIRGGVISDRTGLVARLHAHKTGVLTG